jgi:hypothetical protein
MDKMVICPTCKTNYDVQPQICAKCGFPFMGTEKEKSIFIGQQIIKKDDLVSAKERIKIARIILCIIGGISIVNGFSSSSGVAVIVGLIFIGFCFLTNKKPLISILIPLIVLLLGYTVQTIISLDLLFRGLLWKIVFLTVLVSTLVSIIRAEKIRKKSEFLKEQSYI